MRYSFQRLGLCCKTCYRLARGNGRCEVNEVPMKYLEASLGRLT